MVLPILKIGNKILRQVSKNIELDNPELPNIIQNLKDTLKWTRTGVGLAAPQVGISYRIFIAMGRVRTPEVFINPIIYKQEGDEYGYFEGCLSIPGRGGEVYRKRMIYIQYYDENLKRRKKKINGYKARVILHEYDHLDGILFIDRVGKH